MAGSQKMSFKDFVYKYFAVLNLQSMPVAVKERFNGWVKNNDFPNKDIESWTKDFPQSVAGSWTENDLPNINDLSDDELDNLYILLREVFRSMSLNRADFRSNQAAKDFIDKYYGVGKLLKSTPIKENVKDNIKKFLDILINNEEIKQYVFLTLSSSQRDVLLSVQKGRQDIDSSEARSAINDAISDFLYKARTGEIPEDITNNININFNTILKALEPDDNVSATDREELKKQLPGIFGKLYSDGKIRDIFKENDQKRTLTKQIDQALDKTDYTGKINSSNYIAPKYKDTDPNIRQKIDKGLKNLYSDVLKKFVTAHRANIFIKPTSKAIFAAIDKAKIQPTDDLNALIEKSGDIENSLRGKEPFKAADHFKWLTDKLSTYKKNGLSDSIDGALRWGHQMNRIVTELIKEAAKDGKLEEAKTALEVLSVMQYGTFTSRTMDAINGTDMTIFSDSKLSWNKNEGIQFVTKAFDRTMKFGLQATGYLATGILNRARKRSSVFNNSGDLRTLSDQRKIKLATKHINDEKDKEAKDKNDENTINNSDNVINLTSDHIFKAYGLDIPGAQARLKDHEKKIQDKKAIVTDAQDGMENKESAHKDYEINKSVRDEFDNIPKVIKQSQSNIRKIKREIIKRQNILSSKGAYGSYKNPITGLDMSEAESEHYEAQLLAEIDQLTNQHSQEKDNIKNLKTRHANPAEQQKRNDAEANMLRLEADNNDYLQAETDYNTAKQDFYDLTNDPDYKDIEANLTSYSNATEAKDKAEEAKRVRESDWQKWDQKNRNDYEYLMAYWDFLQTGQTKSMFHWSTKALQEKMDKKNAMGRTQMEQMFEDWKANNY